MMWFNDWLFASDFFQYPLLSCFFQLTFLWMLIIKYVLYPKLDKWQETGTYVLNMNPCNQQFKRNNLKTVLTKYAKSIFAISINYRSSTRNQSDITHSINCRAETICLFNMKEDVSFLCNIWEGMLYFC